MFELLLTLLRGTGHKAPDSATDLAEGDAMRAAESRVDTLKQALAPLPRRQRAEQIALGQLRRRRAALEDRARQALAEGSDDLAAEDARAIARLENEEAARLHALARLDEKLARLRLALAREHRRLDELRRRLGDHDLAPDLALGQRRIEPEDDGHPESAEDRPVGEVRPEDVLVRLRSTPAPTTQYASP